MSTTTDVIRVVLLAFISGLALPLLVQLFLTLRSLQRASLTVERRVDETSREVRDLLAGLHREPAGADLASTLASAAIPAIVAAVRAFRSVPSSEPARNGATPHQEKT